MSQRSSKGRKQLFQGRFLNTCTVPRATMLQGKLGTPAVTRPLSSNWDIVPIRLRRAGRMLHVHSVTVATNCLHVGVRLTLRGSGCLWGCSPIHRCHCRVQVISMAEQPVSGTLKATMASLQTACTESTHDQMQCCCNLTIFTVQDNMYYVVSWLLLTQQHNTH